MKKTLFTALMSLALLALFCGCCKEGGAPTKSSNPAVNQAESTPEAAKAFLESGDFTLIVGLDASFPPYGFQNEKGELVGFDLDLAREVARRQNWKIELRGIDWDAKDAELSSGVINCIWNGFTINGRENLYTWSEPYVDSSQVILVRKDSDIKTKADLAGKVVEAQVDSSGLKAIKDPSSKELLDSLKKLIEVPNFNQAYMELETGVCDAVIIDYGVAITLMATDNATRLLDEELVPEKYGVGFKLGNTVLRDTVQATLDEMHGDGTFTEISKKWFNGQDVTIRK